MATRREYLNRMMKVAGITQRELASRLNITQASISAWVTGKVEISYFQSPERLQELADALETTQQELLIAEGFHIELRTEHGDWESDMVDIMTWFHEQGGEKRVYARAMFIALMNAIENPDEAIIHSEIDHSTKPKP